MTLLIQNDQTYRQSYSSFHSRIPSLKHPVYTRTQVHVHITETDVHVLARERAFKLRINASHRLGGLKGLRESLWTEPKIILRVHAAEWTGIRCLRCPGNEATPRLGFAHLGFFFFSFFLLSLSNPRLRNWPQLWKFMSTFYLADFPFSFLFSSPFLFFTPPPPFFVLPPLEEFANGDFKKGRGR